MFLAIGSDRDQLASPCRLKQSLKRLDALLSAPALEDHALIDEDLA
jgi:hypothetical protein